MKLKKGESLVFAFIVFKSRRHRDSVNKKVMADPRLLPCHGTKLPFDLARMNYGGFKVFVEV